MRFTKSWLLDESTPKASLVYGLLVGLLACLPALVASLPQMGDYPAHLARYHVMLDGGASPHLAAHYGFEWKWTGNLGADLLIGPLAALFGLETAGRVIVIALPILTALAMLCAEWTLRGRIGIGSLVAFAFIWSPALLLGFLNFALSFALALFAFALWVQLEGRGWRWVLFVPIGLIIWLCHVSGWGILGILVFGYEWSRSKSWRPFLAPWPLLASVVPMLLGGSGEGLFTYGANPLSYKYAIWLKAMRDQHAMLDLASLALVLSLLVIALMARRIDGRLGWAALALLVLTWAMPRHIVGGDYADYRLIASGLAVACLAVSWRVPRMVLLLAPALFLGRLWVTSTEWRKDSAELEQVLLALDKVPPGARMASAVLVEKADWGMNPFEHLGGYAVVRRDALINSNFAIPGVHMLSMKQGGPDFTDPSHRILIHRDQQVDLSRFVPAKDMDYLWYHGHRMPDVLPVGAEVIYRTEHSLLLKLAKGTAAR